MGPVSLKMYDKFGLILRIETTVNDVSFFPHYRRVEQRDGRTVTHWARMKKSIYSLPALREALQAATGATWNSSPPWTILAPGSTACRR